MNQQINTETVVCPVCGEKDNAFIRTYRSQHKIFSGCSLFSCRHCEMVFAAPFPSEESLSAYNAGYFENAHGGKSTNRIAEAFFNGIARLRYGYVQNYIRHNAVTVTRVLEIGPGPGYFAHNWLMRNPAHEYFAIESDASCFDSLKSAGVKLIKEFDSIEHIDIVIISHVLEHITDPAGFLKLATQSLRKGGVLFIEVPCQDWKHKLLDEPHLLFFDKTPMSRLLAGIGFGKISVNYYGQQIEKLMAAKSFPARVYTKARNLFIKAGILWPFSKKHKGMEDIDSALERAAVETYKAHTESDTPAWWLRTAALKG